jgi:hypothetical protein
MTSFKRSIGSRKLLPVHELLREPLPKQELGQHILQDLELGHDDTAAALPLE